MIEIYCKNHIVLIFSLGNRSTIWQEVIRSSKKSDRGALSTDQSEFPVAGARGSSQRVGHRNLSLFFPSLPRSFYSFAWQTRMRQESVPLDWFMRGLSKVIRIVDRGQVVWKSYLITHTPLRGPTGLASMSSPGPTCLLVSAKTRTSGKINFRNSKILGVPVLPKSEIRRSLELKRLQQQHEIFMFTSLVGDFCVIFVNYKLFYTR